MWLKNFINYLWNSVVLSGGVPGRTYTIPPYTKTDGVVVSSVQVPSSGLPAISTNNGRANTTLAQVFGVPQAVGAYIGPGTTTGAGRATICFGSGGTPVTAGDYAMESMITAGLTYSPAVALNNDAYTMSYTVTVTATQAVTIREIGYAYNVLLFRQVLDEPVVLDIGDSATFRLDMNLMSAQAYVI